MRSGRHFPGWQSLDFLLSVHSIIGAMENLQVASAWLEKRETELAKPGAVERQNAPDPKLAAVIDRYIEESVAKKLGLTSKSVGRDRRPTLAELDLLMHHFGKIQAHRPQSNPMQQIIAFAIFSTRRQGEITRIAWADFEPAVPPSHPDARVLIQDMKHPGDKAGNNVFCDLPPEATAIIEAMPRIEKEIFPYSVDAISAAFTRACKMLAATSTRAPRGCLRRSG
jgi:hypothetical protein